MPYGDLFAQRCMRFETEADLRRHGCTIEEREEYEQYVENKLTIYSGVDYDLINNGFCCVFFFRCSFVFTHQYSHLRERSRGNRV